ncbi:MAG: glyoxylate/hydroxypyruvate reductase A [Aestuariivita sp.]|nr:glyoxylate/hydroxypyruvate reductase A [Aestuariivita sp.]MCY4347017.1 glyoxylate/hydroxypyruvate reductase A [Aestuariivita sp.]
MLNVLFAAGQERWVDYEPELRAAFTEVGLTVDLRCSFSPEIVDYVIYTPDSHLRDFTPFRRLKAVLNLWAGVESIVENSSIVVPLLRMVDPAMTQGMVEWVVGHTLRHHLGMDTHILASPGDWQSVAPPLASQRRVTVLGLGELGKACAVTLANLGFSVSGWSRSEKHLNGIRTFFGDAGFRCALTDAEIVILLLPATRHTENIINAESLSLLAPKAVLLNSGRGQLINDTDLIAALDTGLLGHATLDVFRKEPLPADHPFWHHPRVTITPHIASETRPFSAAKTIVENVRRGETGDSFLYVVDRDQGY